MDGSNLGCQDGPMLASPPVDGLSKDAYGAIVIGSGFGGAVAACRLPRRVWTSLLSNEGLGSHSEGFHGM
jgi:hypothetical protein